MGLWSLIMFGATVLGVLAYFRTLKLQKRIDELELLLKHEQKHPQSSQVPQVESNEVYISTDALWVPDQQREERSSLDVVGNTAITDAYSSKTKITTLIPKQDQGQESFQKGLHWLTENWAGFLGVSILVLGVTFATVYLSLFATPFIRFLILISIGLAFLVVALLIKQNPLWRELSAWLQSGSGAIVLFTVIATGMFPALHFYSEPMTGLYMLFVGLIYNLILAYLSPKEVLACLHVIISLIALILVPKEVVVFFAAIVVTLAGISLSARHVWNMNLQLSFAAFSLFHFVWFQSQSVIAPIALYGLTGAGIVGISALLVHYQKAYQSEQTTFNLFAHVTIWILLGFQLQMYQLGFAYLYIPLGIATLACLSLSFYAKRKQIEWLFVCDAIVGLLLAMLATLSLVRIDFSHELIALMAFFESLLFATIAYCGRQWLLSKVGSAFVIVSAIALYVTMLQLIPNSNQIIIICLPAIISLYATRWYLSRKPVESSVLEASYERFFPTQLDVLTFIFAGFILFFTVSHYQFGYVIFIASMIAMVINRQLMSQNDHKITYLLFATVVIIFSWTKLSSLGSPALGLLYYGVPPLLLGAVLLKEKTLFLSENESIEDVGVYFAGLHLAIVFFSASWPYSAFYPGIIFLSLGLLLFEASLSLAECNESSRLTLLAASCKNTAVLYLLGYCGLYLLLYLQSEATLFSFLTLTQMLTLIAMIISFYWYFSKPISFADTEQSLLSVSCGWCQTISQRITFDIGFILTLFLLISTFSAPIHPIGYALIGITLCVPFFRRWLPPRARLYSVGLLYATCIQVAIVSSKWASPSLDWYQSTHITGPLSMVLALMQAGILLNEPENKDNHLLQVFYKKPVLFGFLPVFVALAMFLMWRFDKALLTMLWVVEIVFMVGIGYYLKSKNLVQIALAFLAFCVARLITYDLSQSDLLVRALVFVVVGLLMIMIHIIYKKYADRLT